MSQDPTLARRDLFRGAAALVGGAALGLSPVAALANVTTTRPIPAPTPTPFPTPVPSPAPITPFSLGFWNGRHFVDAGSLVANGETLDRVQVTVTGVQGGGFAALDAHAPHPTLGSVPFSLWVAPPAGAVRSRMTVASASDGSLLLAVYTLDKVRHEVRLTASELREGSYLLVPGTADWNTFGLQANDGAITTTGPLPHVRIDVEPA